MERRKENILNPQAFIYAKISSKFFFCYFAVVLKLICIFAVLNTTSVSRFRRATVIGSNILRAFFMPSYSLATAISSQFLLFGDKACGV